MRSVIRSPHVFSSSLGRTWSHSSLDRQRVWNSILYLIITRARNPRGSYNLPIRLTRFHFGGCMFLASWAKLNMSKSRQSLLVSHSTPRTLCSHKKCAVPSVLFGMWVICIAEYRRIWLGLVYAFTTVNFLLKLTGVGEELPEVKPSTSEHVLCLGIECDCLLSVNTCDNVIDIGGMK